MRVLTWNLWWRYGPWRQRGEAIAATLAQVRPDVCGLQEVWASPTQNFAADLAGRLGGLLTAPVVPGLVLVDAWRYADPGDPGHTWHHRNGYQGDSPIPDSRIDYILAGLPRQGRGKVLSAALAGTGPVAGVWPSDH